MEFQTLSDQLGKLTDQRRLFFEIEFHRVSTETAKQAEISFFELLSAFFEQQFVTIWKFGSRAVSGKRILEEIETSQTFVTSISVQANVRSEKIKTKKDFREYLHKRLYYVRAKLPAPTETYLRYFDEHIRPRVGRDDELKTALLLLFREEPRANYDEWNGIDADGQFLASARDPTDPLRHGSIKFSIALECLVNNIDQTAENFLRFVEKLCGILRNANGRVGICTRARWGARHFSDYSSYFSQDYHTTNAGFDQSHLAVPAAPSEWYPFYYIHGAEWGNVISPLTQRLLPGIFEKVPATITRIELRNGGLVVQSKHSISDFTMNDCAEMKCILYPALYPGCSRRVLTPSMSMQELWAHGPRSHWEMVPVDENELTVIESTAFFHHNPSGTEGAIE